MAARSRCSFIVQILVPAPDGSCGISTLLFELAALVRGEAAFFVSGGVLLAFEDGVLLGGSVAAACECVLPCVRACVHLCLLIMYTSSLSKKKKKIVCKLQQCQQTIEHTWDSKRATPKSLL